MPGMGLREGLGLPGRRPVVLATVLSFFLCLAAMAPAAAVVEERVGERVFLVRDKAGTSTQFQMVVLAGCSDEPGGECRGLAHYLEHLVLVGRNPEHNDIAVRFFADATSNGHTSQRATVYVHSLPPRPGGPAADLERLFQFYAARLQDFAITEQEVERERNVVLQEHDWRVGSSPYRRFERKLDRELIPDHPSGQWTIGTRENISALTLAEAQAFHRAWYAINNAYFVVKADMSAEELKAIADRTLGKLRAKRLPPRATLKQPAVPVERKAFTESDRAVKRASVLYRKLIRIEGGDTPAQRAARSILVSFLRSRLPGSPHDALVDRQEVANGTPFVGIDRVAPKTFVVRMSAEVAPDVDTDKLRAAMEAYVDGLAGLAFPQDLLDRLKQRAADARRNEDKDAVVVYNRLVSWLSNRSDYADLALWPQRIAGVSQPAVREALVSLAAKGRVVTGSLTPASEAASR